MHPGRDARLEVSGQKSPTMRHLLPVLSLAFTAVPAAAGTWIVDDDGGPGVDFTDIAAAIAASAPGDVLLVLPGVYSSFLLDKPLTVLASSGALVAGGLGQPAVQGLPAGTTTAISGLTFDLGKSLHVQDCLGTVVLDQLTFNDSGIGVSNSTDTRLRASTLGLGLALGSSRVEVSACTIEGNDGTTWSCPGGNGSVAVSVDSSARAHLYRSSVKGGNGGTPNDSFNCGGGDAAQGIVVTGGDLLLAGDPAHMVLGGKGGSGVFSGYDAAALYLLSGANARISGVTVPGLGTPVGLEVPFPRDPTLFILDQAGAGETVTFRVQTELGAQVELMLGRKPALGAQVDSEEVLLLVPLRTFQLGIAPANGVASMNWVTPGTLPVGFTYFAQGRVTLPGGDQRYTNSVPLIVR